MKGKNKSAPKEKGAKKNKLMLAADSLPSPAAVRVVPKYDELLKKAEKLDAAKENKGKRIAVSRIFYSFDCCNDILILSSVRSNHAIHCDINELMGNKLCYLCSVSSLYHETNECMMSVITHAAFLVCLEKER